MHEGVNLHCDHWIIFTSLYSISHLPIVNGLSQRGVKVQKKTSVCISSEFYYNGLIPYVHDFSFITCICLTTDNFLF